ncbi:MAG: PDZ domain-containing protein, partial [Phycisphaerales bacterium]|nr:PDZ domain-containing protein [Phycisphaerales bacterium]
TGAGSVTGVKIRFGIAPSSYSDGKPGVGVGEVFTGTSAGDAGIKVGDRLIKWNGKSIDDVEAWMTFLAQHKPGDEVEVTVVRDKEELPIKVKLKARETGAR